MCLMNFDYVLIKSLCMTKVAVPREAFGVHLDPGGQVRLTSICGGDDPVFDLPAEIPPSLDLTFKICPEAGGGTMIFVGGLQVRRARK